VLERRGPSAGKKEPKCWKEGAQVLERRSLPKPLRRRGCERIQWDMSAH